MLGLLLITLMMTILSQVTAVVDFNIKSKTPNDFKTLTFATNMETKEATSKLTAGNASKYAMVDHPVNYDSKNGTVASKSGGWAYYNQCDYRWGNQMLGW